MTHLLPLPPGALGSQPPPRAQAEWTGSEGPASSQPVIKGKAVFPVNRGHVRGAFLLHPLALSLSLWPLLQSGSCGPWRTWLWVVRVHRAGLLLGAWQEPHCSPLCRLGRLASGPCPGRPPTSVAAALAFCFAVCLLRMRCAQRSLLRPVADPLFLFCSREDVSDRSKPQLLPALFEALKISAHLHLWCHLRCPLLVLHPMVHWASCLPIQ